MAGIRGLAWSKVRQGAWREGRERRGAGAHRVPRIDIISLRYSVSLGLTDCSSAAFAALSSTNPHSRWHGFKLQHQAGGPYLGSRGVPFRILPSGPPDQAAGFFFLQTTHSFAAAAASSVAAARASPPPSDDAIDECSGTARARA
eukprot:scaffold91782_cov96-Phaeocystis_antarctica.AAC.2